MFEASSAIGNAVTSVAFKLGQRDHRRGKPADANPFDLTWGCTCGCGKRQISDVWTQWLGGWIAEDLTQRMPIT